MAKAGASRKFKSNPSAARSLVRDGKTGLWRDSSEKRSADVNPYKVARSVTGKRSADRVDPTS